MLASAKQFKKYTLFINTNGYLSLVYADNPRYVSVINYNGSIYEISKESNHEYVLPSNKVTVEDFFKKFPLDVLNWKYTRPLFDTIKKKYYQSSFKLTEELLLII